MCARSFSASECARSCARSLHLTVRARMYACIGNCLCNGNGRPRRRRRACGGKASPTPSVKLLGVSCTRLRSLYLSVTLSLSPTRARTHTHTRTKTYSVRKTIRRAWRPPTGASSNKCSKNKVTANSTTSMPAIPGLDARRRPGGHKKMNACLGPLNKLCVSFLPLPLPRCHPTGRCAYRPAVTLRLSKKLLSLSLSLSLPPSLPPSSSHSPSPCASPLPLSLHPYS
jgi:hypothetical protein